MIPESVLAAFANSYDPPYWIIEEFANRASSDVQEALRATLDAVTTEKLSSVDEDARAHAHAFFSAGDRDWQARLLVVAQEAAGLIEARRLALAAQFTAAPPYGHSALKGIEVDEEGLVPLDAFHLEGDALCRNGYAFFMLPPVPGSNANYWLLNELQRAGLASSVRVRLDPLLHGPSEELSGRFYKATIYGRELDWDRIRRLREVDHGQWMPGRMSRRHRCTEYAWIPHDDEVDFLCEEVPVEAEIQTRGSRYLHAIYDKKHHEIKHLDGAIRITEPRQYADRVTKHVRNAGKVGIRVKTFRTDRPITPAALGAIAQSFFFWNYDVARYFGAPIHPDL